jgi:hypothetical protein
MVTVQTLMKILACAMPPQETARVVNGMMKVQSTSGRDKEIFGILETMCVNVGIPPAMAGILAGDSAQYHDYVFILSSARRLTRDLHQYAPERWSNEGKWIGDLKPVVVEIEKAPVDGVVLHPDDTGEAEAAAS